MCACAREARVCTAWDFLSLSLSLSLWVCDGGQAARTVPKRGFEMGRRANSGACVLPATRAVMQRTREGGWLTLFADRLAWTPDRRIGTCVHYFCNVTALQTPARAVVVHETLCAHPEVYVCEMPTEHAALAARVRARTFPAEECAPTRKVVVRGTLACRGVVLGGDRGSLTVQGRLLMWQPLTPGLKPRVLSVDAIASVQQHASSSMALWLCVSAAPPWDMRFPNAVDAARVAWLLRQLCPRRLVPKPHAGGAHHHHPHPKK